MPNATTAIQKKISKPSVNSKSKAGSVLRVQLLTGQALLKDMKAYRKKVASTPESARDFLTRLGVKSTSGKAKAISSKVKSTSAKVK